MVRAGAVIWNATNPRSARLGLFSGISCTPRTTRAEGRAALCAARRCRGGAPGAQGRAVRSKGASPAPARCARSCHNRPNQAAAPLSPKVRRATGWMLSCNACRTWRSASWPRNRLRSPASMAPARASNAGSDMSSGYSRASRSQAMRAAVASYRSSACMTSLRSITSPLCSKMSRCIAAPRIEAWRLMIGAQQRGIPGVRVTGRGRQIHVLPHPCRHDDHARTRREFLSLPLPLLDDSAQLRDNRRVCRRREQAHRAGALEMLAYPQDAATELHARSQDLHARTLLNHDRRGIGVQHIAERHLHARHDVGHIVEAQRALRQLLQPIARSRRQQWPAGAEQVLGHPLAHALDLQFPFGDKPIHQVDLHADPELFVHLRAEFVSLPIVEQAPEQSRQSDPRGLAMALEQPIDHTFGGTVMPRRLGSKRLLLQATVLVLLAAAARAGIVSSDFCCHWRLLPCQIRRLSLAGARCPPVSPTTAADEPILLGHSCPKKARMPAALVTGLRAARRRLSPPLITGECQAMSMALHFRSLRGSASFSPEQMTPLQRCSP